MARIPFSETDGVTYRDLNGNGQLDPYEDRRLSPEERAADLLPRLSAAEKAGLLFHPIIGIGAPGDFESVTRPSRGSLNELVGRDFMNHFNLHEMPDVREMVRWHNALQELAEQSPHGIPVTLSTDPRHAFVENSGTSFSTRGVSRWPEAIGLAAIGDAALVERFAHIVRRDYRALGISCALHPQLDLATEARWARQAQTFGWDPELSTELGLAYLRGMQGDQLDESGVACTTKHFPGGGPQRDGEDPHFPYGREQVYPGGRFEEHLAPFRAAIAAGTSAIMPYYGMPVGLEIDGEAIEDVGFAFSKRLITGMLRQELGFDGVVLTDFGLVTDREVFGKPMPGRAWGLEQLTPAERVLRILDAGCDQFGGEACIEVLLELLRDGTLDETALDEPARRILLVKFQLGLFDDPYLDEDESVATIGGEDARVAGHRAQAEAVTVLRNEGALPLDEKLRVYVEGFAGTPDGVTVVADPAAADVAILRLAAPFEPRDHYFLETMFHQGSLDLAQEIVDHVAELAEVVPVIVDVFLERPAILTPLQLDNVSIVGDFGASDAAIVDALTGRIPLRGRLPFDLPASGEAVAAGHPDAPGTLEPSLYGRGFGLAI